MPGTPAVTITLLADVVRAFYAAVNARDAEARAGRPGRRQTAVC